MTDHEKTYLSLTPKQRKMYENVSLKYSKAFKEMMFELAEITKEGVFTCHCPVGHADIFIGTLESEPVRIPQQGITYEELEKQRFHTHRVYISGPISGYDIHERRKTFKKIQAFLEAQDYEVVNPMENGLPDDAPTRAHMRRDIELLMTCDSIFMMRYWTHSKGCKVEFDVATSLGLPVLFEESGELIKFE